MKKKMVKQFVIYSRKSKFTGKGESVENQIELCHQYIMAHYSQEEAESALIYEDEGFSGGNLERPNFKKMMNDSHHMSFAAIVVYRLDRISRNIGDFANLIEDLGERDIDFISIKEQFDTSSPMGRAMMYIASVFSQLERETIAERIRDNLHELAKTGRWLGGNTPTGYESESISNVTIDGKVRKACKLKIIPDEINLVKLIFDKFIETGSLTQVDEYLLEKRYKTKFNKDFSRFAIKAILTNPVYMIADDIAYNYFIDNDVDLFSDRVDFDGIHGIMAYNRTLQRTGKANQAKPINEWIVSVGKHEGVISGSEWVTVQNKLSINKSKSYRRPRSHVALLSGVLVCGKCGSFIRPKLTNRTNAKGEQIYTYMCTMKERSHGNTCNMKNVNGNILDAKIIDEIKKMGKSSSDLAKQITKSKKILSGNMKGYDAQADRVKYQLKDNDETIKALVISLARASGTSAEEYIMAQIDELHHQNEILKNQYEEINLVKSQSKMATVEFDILKNMLADFGKNIDSFNVEQKRAVIRTFIKKIVWDGEKIHIYLFGQNGEIDFPDISENVDLMHIGGNSVSPLGEFFE